MAIVETEAFVLRHYELGERDKIVVFFSKKRGKIKCIAKGAKSSKSRYGSSLEPLNLVALSYYEKQERELFYIKGCELVRSVFSYGADIMQGLVLFYMAELLDSFVQEEHQEEQLFRLTDRCLCLVGKKENFLKIMLYFEVWLLKLEGILPSFFKCESCGKMLNGSDCFSVEKLVCLCENCTPGVGRMPLGNEFHRLVGSLFKMAPDDFVKIAISEGEIEKIRRIAKLLITDVLGRRPKSLKVMEQIVAGEK